MGGRQRVGVGIATGDNAAMIGAQAYYEYLAGHTADESLNGLPTMEITEQFGA